MKKSLLLMATFMAILAVSCEKEPAGDSNKPGNGNGNGDKPEPPVEKVIDLNAENPETANCYIVSKDGRYCFNATVMGNGDAGLMPAFETKSTGIAPVKAKLLWDETPTGKPLVEDVEYKDGKVYFTSARFDGNAVIAVTDKDDKILWSWHIWSTVTPATVKVDYSYPANEETGYAGESGSWEVMDRNLGALSNDVSVGEDSFGLYYQWGRKDPFSRWRLDTSMAEGAFHPQAGSSTEKSDENTIQYAVEHPDTWLIGYQYGSDPDQRSWLYSADDKAQYVFNELWGNNFTMACYPPKTIYDPCPAGYRLATHEFYRYKFQVNKDEAFGMDENGVLTIYPGLVFPKASFIDYSGEILGNDTSVWTDSAAWGGNDKSFRIWNTNDPSDQTGRGRAFPVRCMKVSK